MTPDVTSNTLRIWTWEWTICNLLHDSPAAHCNRSISGYSFLLSEFELNWLLQKTPRNSLRCTTERNANFTTRAYKASTVTTSPLTHLYAYIFETRYFHLSSEWEVLHFSSFFSWIRKKYANTLTFVRQFIKLSVCLRNILTSKEKIFLSIRSHWKHKLQILISWGGILKIKMYSTSSLTLAMFNKSLNLRGW